MNFGWLKRFMPRGLYGRAALILLLPILTVQLVVSITFIQRHFEGVTRQMTRSVAMEIAYLVEIVEAAPTLAAAQAEVGTLIRPLSLDVRLPSETAPQADSRGFLDLSGRAIIATMHEGVPGVTGVALLDDEKQVAVGVATRHGAMEVRLPRGRVSASNPHQLLVLMVGTGILMTFIAYLFLRNQLRPIKRMAAAAEAFGKGQTVRFRPTGATEVRAAGHAFLEMRNRIERQIEQRTMMLSGVSHDLRTPLTRLRLGLSLLDADPEEVAALERDVEDMQRMLDGFLAFARGDALEDTERVDPATLAARVVDNARRAGQRVTLAGVEGEGTVILRPQAVERALDNLIGNAVRHGSMAEVRLLLTERTARFVVEDDGPGIPDDKREEALRPFSRLDAARNQNQGGGVGLGLTIASDIARNHGGKLMLGKSERLGGLKAELLLAR